MLKVSIKTYITAEPTNAYDILFNEKPLLIFKKS